MQALSFYLGMGQARFSPGMSIYQHVPKRLVVAKHNPTSCPLLHLACVAACNKLSHNLKAQEAPFSQPHLRPRLSVALMLSAEAGMEQGLAAWGEQGRAAMYGKVVNSTSAAANKTKAS